MPRLLNHVPKYSHHRASGQALVTIEGRDIYLGKWNTRDSRNRYDQIISEWTAAGRKLPTDPQAITIAEVAAAFRRHALVYYRDRDGNPGKTVINFDEALKPVLKLYARLPAVEFGPLKLKAVREKMIEYGRVRSNINRLIGYIKTVFRWAGENELVPASVHHALATVQGLQAGRSEAVEAEGVKPVPIAHVEAVIPYVSTQVAAMIRLQLLTGMRPGEVVIMRGTDLDTTSKLWTYKPHRHKNQWRGIDRTIYLGPKAADIIRPFLKSDLTAYLFSPADAEAERRRKLSEARKTPLSCGNRVGTNRQRKPRRTPGHVYGVGAYLVAVYRGCDTAFPPPADLVDPVKLKAWRKEHRWHVHRLRHSAATELRKNHGLEAAQVILGHRRLEATQIYAEKNVEQAQRIMALVG